MRKGFQYSITYSPEKLSYSYPVALRGDTSHFHAAMQAGYDAIELHTENLDNLDLQHITSQLKQNNLKLSAIATGLEYSINRLNLIDDSKQIRDATVQRLCRYVDVAGYFNCPVIVGCLRGNIPDQARGHDEHKYYEYLRDGIEQLCIYASSKNTVILLEAINYYVNNYLNKLEDVARWIHDTGQKNLKLHIDTHHMNIEEKDLTDAILNAGSTIGYVHFSDSNRMYPGAGNIDFSAIIAALYEIQYTGYISMEITPFPSPDIAAMKAISNIKDIEPNFRA